MRVLVYDNKSYLYRFVKTNFEKHDETIVTKCNSTNIKNENIKSYNYVLYAFYNDFDVIHFIECFKSNQNIILLFEDFDNAKKLFKINSFFYCINLNNSKKEILESLKIFLKK